MSEPIATVATYTQFVEALRTRLTQLGMTHQALDALTGLQPGYTGKVFSSRKPKGLTGMTFDLMLQGLALKLIVVDDPKALEKMQARYEKRKHAPAMRTAVRMTKKIATADPRQARKMVKKRWAKTSPEQRTRIARKLAKTRWKKHRERIRAARARAAALLIAEASCPHATAVLPCAPEQPEQGQFRAVHTTGGCAAVTHHTI